MTVGNIGIHAILVIGAISRDRCQRAGDLVEQRTNLGGIVHLEFWLSRYSRQCWTAAVARPVSQSGD